MDLKIRTVVNFYKEDLPIRTVHLKWTIPNVANGQIFAFDHPQLGKCFSGIVYNIQHAIYLDSKEAPVTYIDVRVNG